MRQKCHILFVFCCFPPFRKFGTGESLQTNQRNNHPMYNTPMIPMLADLSDPNHRATASSYTVTVVAPLCGNPFFPPPIWRVLLYKSTRYWVLLSSFELSVHDFFEFLTSSTSSETGPNPFSSLKSNDSAGPYSQRPFFMPKPNRNPPRGRRTRI